MGYKECGLIPSVLGNAGGYYMGLCLFPPNYSYRLTVTVIISDLGASQYIIDGKIKLKSGTAIKEFTEGGLMFEDGTQLAANVILFCTG